MIHPSLQEYSYGAILYDDSTKIRRFILVGAKRKNGTIEYGFPKGHPEPEDKGNILTTIIREIQEETGISSDAIETDNFSDKNKAFSVSYAIQNKKGEQTFKTSTYYALKIKKPEVLTTLTVSEKRIHEIEDIVVKDEHHVLSTLSHDNEKKLFQARQEQEKSQKDNIL